MGETKREKLAPSPYSGRFELILDRLGNHTIGASQIFRTKPTVNSRFLQENAGTQRI